LCWFFLTCGHWRDDYQKNAEKKYGIDYLLENEKDNLLAEKKRIEDATGITAAHELEQTRKHDAAIRQRQEREQYDAKRRAMRLENPNVNKSNEHEI